MQVWSRRYSVLAYFILCNERNTPSTLKQRKKTTHIANAVFQGLQICRILETAGHRVILADLSKFRFSAARFSNSVDKWVTLPDLDGSLKAIESYKVDNCIIVMLEYLHYLNPLDPVCCKHTYVFKVHVKKSFLILTHICKQTKKFR